MQKSRKGSGREPRGLEVVRSMMFKDGNSGRSIVAGVWYIFVYVHVVPAPEVEGAWGKGAMTILSGFYFVTGLLYFCKHTLVFSY